jgi:uncharacterized membrane protein YgcG
MAYEAESPRGEEKLRLILGQIASIRSRLNALALQHGVFGALTFVLCAAALTVAAAFVVGPLSFVLFGLLAGLVALFGVVREMSVAWRMRSTEERAARIADERAALKGRLTTMVGVTSGGKRSALWPYLVEDTLALREEFTKTKIEPRWMSRWFYAALASFALAALVFRFAVGVRKQRIISHQKSAPTEATVDLGDLDIRPADPSSSQGADIDADPATLRELAQKLRDSGNNPQHDNRAARLMADARDIASALQNKLTGGKPAAPPTRLKLTDRKGGSGAAGKNGAQGNEQSKGGSESKGGRSGNGRSGQNPPQQEAGTPLPGLPDLGGFGALNGLNGDKRRPTGAPGENSGSREQSAQGAPNGGGGANHGSGSDPEHLFGDAEAPPVGSDTFRIPIEVQSSDEGTSSSGPAYLPSRTKSKLNSSQYPDEPFERASIPAPDRVIIKRVFER